MENAHEVSDDQSLNDSMNSAAEVFGPSVDPQLFGGDSVFFLILSVVGFSMAIITVSANSTLLFIIFRDTRRFLQTPPSFLITNLCVSDLIVGLVVDNLVGVKDVYRFHELPVPDHLDPILRLFLGLSLFVSSGTIIALSYDRFIVVTHPLKYKSTVTVERVKIFIVLLWSTSLAFCVLPVVKIPERILAIAVAHIHASLPAVVLTAMYFKVFRSLKERKRELREAGITSEMKPKKVLDRERKMVLTILIVLALFYVTYLPEFIALHVLHFWPPSEQSRVFRMVEIVLSRFLFLNSAMNPFVYSWRLPKYRKALIDNFTSWKLYLSKICCNARVNIPCLQQETNKQ